MKNEIFREFISLVFSYEVKVGSIENELGSFSTFTFKGYHSDLDSLVSDKMSVRSDSLKIYGIDGLQEINYFQDDGVKFFTLYDFLKRNWMIINASTKEEVACSGIFGFNKE